MSELYRWRRPTSAWPSPSARRVVEFPVRDVERVLRLVDALALRRGLVEPLRAWSRRYGVVDRLAGLRDAFPRRVDTGRADDSSFDAARCMNHRRRLVRCAANRRRPAAGRRRSAEAWEEMALAWKVHLARELRIASAVAVTVRRTGRHAATHFEVDAVRRCRRGVSPTGPAVPAVDDRPGPYQAGIRAFRARTFVAV